jgi:aspartate aminotransferase-like enzyme
MSESSPLYFVPGPVPIAEHTIQAMHELAYHKSEQFSVIHAALKAELRRIIKTDGDIVIAPGSGTTGAEIIMRGMVPFGSRILILVNGRFSKRWQTLGNLFGHEIVVLECAWGEAFSEEMLASIIQKESFHSIWITHTETSTGVTIPLEHYCSIIKVYSPDSFIIVDAVSSIILEHIDMDVFGIDCLFTASQKALAAPPGACIIAFSNRVIEHIHENAMQNNIQPSMVHDLSKLIHASREDVPAFTPPLPIISALHASCNHIVQDPQYHEKLALQAQRIRTMIQSWKQCTMNAEYLSNGVSIVYHHQAEEIIKAASERGIIIAGGQDAWKSMVFRIGHMVLYTDEDLTYFHTVMHEIMESIA